MKTNKQISERLFVLSQVRTILSAISATEKPTEHHVRCSEARVRLIQRGCQGFAVVRVVNKSGVYNSELREWELEILPKEI